MIHILKDTLGTARWCEKMCLEHARDRLSLEPSTQQVAPEKWLFSFRIIRVFEDGKINNMYKIPIPNPIVYSRWFT